MATTRSNSTFLMRSTLCVILALVPFFGMAQQPILPSIIDSLQKRQIATEVLLRDSLSSISIRNNQDIQSIKRSYDTLVYWGLPGTGISLIVIAASAFGYYRKLKKDYKSNLDEFVNSTTQKYRSEVNRLVADNTNLLNRIISLEEQLRSLYQNKKIAIVKSSSGVPILISYLKAMDFNLDNCTTIQRDESIPEDSDLIIIDDEGGSFEKDWITTFSTSHQNKVILYFGNKYFEPNRPQHLCFVNHRSTFQNALENALKYQEALKKDK